MEHVKIILFLSYYIPDSTHAAILNEMLSEHHWVGTCEYKVKYSCEMKT